jgi:hypothetical protein
VTFPTLERTQRKRCKTFQARNWLCFDASNSSTRSWIAFGVIDMVGSVQRNTCSIKPIVNPWLTGSTSDYNMNSGTSHPDVHREESHREGRTVQGVRNSWKNDRSSVPKRLFTTKHEVFQGQPSQPEYSSYFGLRRRNCSPRYRTQMAEIFARYHNLFAKLEWLGPC